MLPGRGDSHAGEAFGLLGGSPGGSAMLCMPTSIVQVFHGGLGSHGTFSAPAVAKAVGCGVGGGGGICAISDGWVPVMLKPGAGVSSGGHWKMLGACVCVSVCVREWVCVCVRAHVCACACECVWGGGGGGFWWWWLQELRRVH